MEERKCEKCTLIQKKQWGCDAEAKQPYDVLDGVELSRCPRRPFLENSQFYSELFWSYKQFMNGFLSEDGGLQDQPNKLMEYFQIIGIANTDGERDKKAMDEKRRNRIEGVRRKY